MSDPSDNNEVNYVPVDPGLTAVFSGAVDPLVTTDYVCDVDRTVIYFSAVSLGTAVPEADLVSVPGYRVIREIARGGMGRVLAAHDLHLDRDVAIKVLLPGAKADRFVRESKITARLPHPGIPPVYALGTLDDGSPFLAMKLIVGQTLADELKTADRPRLFQVFTQVCQAVGFAHSRGIIHRDLKPSNVMVGAFGEVQVMDWGLAKDLRSGEVEVEPQSLKMLTVPVGHLESEPSTQPGTTGETTEDRTQAGQVLGTPAYMAPEQAHGDAADARSDVFALGGILCAILTGKPPFGGNSMVEVIRRAATADLTETMSRLDACGADAEIKMLCRHCLSPSPADRPANGQVVADRLTDYLNGVQERLQATERERAVQVAREVEQGKRRRLQFNLAAAMLLILVAGVVVSSYFAVEANFQSKVARKNAKTAETRATEADAARRSVEQTLADSYTASGLQAAESGKPAESLIWFAAAAQRSVDDSARERSNGIRFWSWARQIPLPVRAIQNNGEVLSITVHPEGRFALSRTYSGFSLWDLTDEQPVTFPDGATIVSAVTWNRSGTQIAMALTGGGVGVFRFPQRERVTNFEYPGAISSLAFDETGTRLAVASDHVRVWDCEHSEFVTPAYPHPAIVADVVFNKSGDRIATTCADCMCRVWSVPGDATQSSPLFAPVPHKLIEKTDWPVHPIAPIFLDGDRGLLTRCDDSRIAWIDAKTGATVRNILPLPDGTLGWIAASPNREYFASSSKTASTFIVRLFSSADGSPVGSTMSHLNHVYSGEFHPDGKSLLTASADRTVRIWSVPDGLPLSAQLQHQNEVVSAAFGPHGHSFVTAQLDGLMRLWKHEPFERAIPTGGAEAYVQMTPDGRYAMAAGFDSSRQIVSPQVVSIATGEAAGPPLDTVGSLVNNAAFAPDGKRVVLLTSHPKYGNQFKPGIKLREQPGQVLVFDWGSGRRLLEPLATSSEPIGAAFSSDGKRLAVICAKGEILIVDPDTGRSIHQLSHDAVYNPGFFIRDFVRFFPDGSRFVTWGPGYEARVWDTESGQLAYKISVPAAPTSLLADFRFSPDGQFLATASFNKTVSVFDAATGRSAIPPLSHPDWVFSLRFSPDGQYIATASRDGKARIWDWKSGTLTAPPMAHMDEVLDVCYAQQGQIVLTAGRDRTIRVWDAALGKPLGPPLPTGGYCVRVAVTPDDAHVVAAGRMPKILVYRVSDLMELEPYPMGGLQKLAEVISGVTLHSGGGIANLTTAEWFERYRTFRDHNPKYPPLEYENESRKSE